MFGLITVHALNVELLHLFGAVRSRWSVRADDTGPRGHHKLGFDQSGTYLKKNPSFCVFLVPACPFLPHSAGVLAQPAPTSPLLVGAPVSGLGLGAEQGWHS